MSNQAKLEEIAVVILNFNGAAFMEEFIPTVMANSGNAHIYIADNGSSDDSLEVIDHLTLKYDNLDAILMTENTGFCGGYNRALANLEEKYFVLLNSDIEIKSDWLTPLWHLMDANEQIGACQPRILAQKQPDSLEYAGAAGGFMDYLGYPFCRGRIFDQLEKDGEQWKQSYYISWATGAAMMVRSELYKKLGGLDESFFAHMEEIDLCWRMQNAGYRVAYCGESEVYHVGGGTLAQGSPRKTYLNYRNGLMMMYKNLPSSKLFPIIFMRLCLDGVSAMPHFFKGEWKHVYQIIRSHFHFYGRIGSLRKWRKKNTTQQNAYASGVVYKKSIVAAYFLRKKRRFADLKFPLAFIQK